MFAKDPSGYSLVRTTAGNIFSERKKGKIGERAHTDRPGSLDCIDLRVHTPSGTTIIYHSFESQCVVTQIEYLGCRRCFLSANICTIFGDIPCRGLCSGGKTGHLVRTWSQCPDVCIHGIARSKISILGSKLVDMIISECHVSKCDVSLPEWCLCSKQKQDGRVLTQNP